MDDPQNLYAAAHRHLKGPGDARPTGLQIVKDNEPISALSDLVILITGCSSGLGVETARALATTGATLFLTARVLNKACEALGADILSNTKVHLLRLDLDSLDSVRSCLCTFLSQSPELNILNTDAGIWHVACGETKDNSPIEFNDLNLEKPGVYTPSKGYARSKLAIVYMISEMRRRYGSSANGGRPGVSCLAVMPGGICTVLQQHADGVIPEFLRRWYCFENIMRILNIQKSPEQGAATSVLAAVGERFEGREAMYLEYCGEAVPVKEGWGVLDGVYSPGRPGNGKKIMEC